VRYVPDGVEGVSALYGPCAADNLLDLYSTAIGLGDLRHERSGKRLEEPGEEGHQARGVATEPAAKSDKAGKKRNK